MITTIDTPLSQWRDMSLTGNQMACWWLGQAGFLLRHRDHSFVFDPYLSDSLAVKYRDAQFKHTRMMPVPVEPKALSGIDWVFCTHQHTDHMDGGTLPDLMAANPSCTLLAPAAAQQHLINEVGVARACVRSVNAGQHLELSPGIAVDVIAAAHEDLEFDEAGNSVSLGYILDVQGTRLYHSGDCVPYEGLTEALKNLQIDVAMLPVNGRDAARTHSGILGNFHFEEAVSLCCEAGIGAMVPHHFGLFDFNTVDPAVLQGKIDRLETDLQVVVPQMDQALVIGG